MTILLTLSTIIFAILYISERTLRIEAEKMKEYWYQEEQKWMKAYFKATTKQFNKSKQ